ncbi:MAG: hypothetical protein ACYCVY_11235 [Acidiferrobacteraceae bacterium]
MSFSPNTDRSYAANRRTRIRRLAWRAFALLLACAPAFAAPGPKTPALTLAYDRTPAVCHYLLHLYNRDLARKGYVDTRAHRVFRVIHWTPLVDRPLSTKPDNDPAPQIAFVDINNEGRVEPVVRDLAYIGPRAVGSAGLNILYAAPASRQQFDVWMRNPSKYARAQFPPLLESVQGLFYTLKHVPARSPSPETRPFRRPALPTAALALHPLRYQDTVYVSVSVNAEPGKIRIGGPFGRWVVIGKYHPDNTFEDVCYFREGAFRPAQRR